jgi:transcriptional regulator with XRE-family HTH domain
MGFAKNLKNLLAAHNTTQKELAEKVNIPSSLVSEYISDKKHPSAENAKKIATFFKVSLDSLMDADWEVYHITQEQMRSTKWEILRIYILLNKEDQKTVLEVARALQAKAEGKKKTN